MVARALVQRTRAECDDHCRRTSRCTGRLRNHRSQRLPRPTGGRARSLGFKARRAARSAGAKLFFLPKYSPDLNPIEQVFAKLKHFLRKLAARTVETVCLAIGEVLQLFKPEECASYLANSGYGAT